jgi:hypothetical protein
LLPIFWWPKWFEPSVALGILALSHWRRCISGRYQVAWLMTFAAITMLRDKSFRRARTEEERHRLVNEWNQEREREIERTLLFSKYVCAYGGTWSLSPMARICTSCCVIQLAAQSVFRVRAFLSQLPMQLGGVGWMGDEGIRWLHRSLTSDRSFSPWSRQGAANPSIIMIPSWIYILCKRRGKNKIK